jgi:plasmid stabilization system protein ParE
MKLSFRATAQQDLRWFEYYHTHRVSGGRKKAELRLRAAIQLLKANPYAGVSVGEGNARSFPVLRTAFVLHYVVISDTIEIVRVWDSRADPEKLYM